MSSIAVGVDVGGTKVLAVAIDTAAPDQILAECRAPTPSDVSDLVEVIAGVAQKVMAGLGDAGHGPAGAVGVGLAGIVDTDGVLRLAPNLSGARDLSLREPLVDVLGVEVTIDNDANCATWAEVLAGAGRGAGDALLVTLGTGIGGGLVIGGQLHHGAHGFAGEPGHMVVDPAGPVCPCGRRGCWERYASGSGLGRLGRRAAEDGTAAGLLARTRGDLDAIDGELVASAARDGDEGALAVMREFSGWLALGLANLVDLLDPALVLIGGGVADVADLFLDSTRDAFAEQVLGSAERTVTRIEVATLGSRAGAIGAALLAGDPEACAGASRGARARL